MQAAPVISVSNNKNVYSAQNPSAVKMQTFGIKKSNVLSAPFTYKLPRQPFGLCDIIINLISGPTGKGAEALEKYVKCIDSENNSLSQGFLNDLKGNFPAWLRSRKIIIIGDNKTNKYFIYNRKKQMLGMLELRQDGTLSGFKIFDRTKDSYKTMDISFDENGIPSSASLPSGQPEYHKA